MDKFLSKSYCAFRKGFIAQHCLFKIKEKWKHSVDNGKAFEAQVEELSNAVFFLPHELLTAKSKAYRLIKKL